MFTGMQIVDIAGDPGTGASHLNMNLPCRNINSLNATVISRYVNVAR